MASSNNRWHALKLSQNDTPPLFVKVAFGSSEYSLYITDLSNVWCESIDRDALLDRADSDGCSINPGEDLGQMQILLEKIQSALSGASGTFLQLRGGGAGTLHLFASAPLPAPLPSLEWPFILIKQNSRSLTTEVISPLLLSLHRKQSGIENLQSQLREKDHVISRLLDRLESSGTDLTTVFPGTSNVKPSKKIPQRTQIARYVRGLELFDAHQWHPVMEALPSIDSLFNNSDSMSEAEKAQFADLHGHALDDWWETVGSNSTSTTNSQRLAPAGSTKAEDEEETDDEDFQVAPNRKCS